MSRFIFLALVLGFTINAQDTEEQRKFAGTWEARYKGAVVCTIKLQVGERIFGAAYGCAVHVNNEGNLVETMPAVSEDPSPIIRPNLNGDTLSFGLLDEGETQATKLELHLVRDGQAELRFVDAPVAIKPLRFDRKRQALSEIQHVPEAGEVVGPKNR
jgi:hypothetical protein